MESFMLFALTSFAAMALVSSTSPSQELSVATMEMQRANYFTFAMLINMVILDPRLSQNVTFLMPNDRILSKSAVPETAVSDFLRRHSIPSPLLFANLDLVPDGSVIPTSLPNYSVKISNGGRKSYFLNNVKIISPNICSHGSIKCHGIDGVLSFSPAVASCTSNQNVSSQPAGGQDSSSSGSSLASPPAVAPSPLGNLRKSESVKIDGGKALGLCVILLVAQIFFAFMF